MPSRNLSDLHPLVHPLALEAIGAWAAAGLDVRVICTYRSPAEQALAYAQGRTAPGPIVTRARPGYSAHNYTMPDGRPASLALDVAPFRDGKPVWGTEGDDLALWQAVGEIGTAAGLAWYGVPDAPFREFPHFQHPQAGQYLKHAAEPHPVNA